MSSSYLHLAALHSIMQRYQEEKEYVRCGIGDLQGQGCGVAASANMRQPGVMTSMALPMDPPSTPPGGQLPASSTQGPTTRAASFNRARAPSGPFNLNPAGSFDLASFFAS